MARPTKLTGELAEAIAGLLRRGLPLASIAFRVGIDRDTLLEWRKSSEFSGVFREAESEAEDRWLAQVEAGVNGPNPKWLLERRFRDWWAPKQDVQHSGAIAGIGMPQEAAAALLRDALRELEGKDDE